MARSRSRPDAAKAPEAYAHDVTPRNGPFKLSPEQSGFGKPNIITRLHISLGNVKS